MLVQIDRIPVGLGGLHHPCSLDNDFSHIRVDPAVLVHGFGANLESEWVVAESICDVAQGLTGAFRKAFLGILNDGSLILDNVALVDSMGSAKGPPRPRSPVECRTHRHTAGW